MSEKIWVRGVPRVVRFETDTAEVWFSSRETDAGRGSGYVSHADAAKALDAMHAKREVEIVETDGVRTVRLVPTVVVKARGKVRSVSLACDEEDARSVIHCGAERYYSAFGTHNALAAARAMADNAEVEIVSVDGCPDTVRVCS